MYPKDGGERSSENGDDLEGDNTDDEDADDGRLDRGENWLPCSTGGARNETHSSLLQLTAAEEEARMCSNDGRGG